MDPQKLSSLDPKLRDAYQRVMGTPIPAPQADPMQNQTPATPAEPTTTPIPSPTQTPSSAPVPEPIPASDTPPIQEPAIPNPQPIAPEPVSEPPPAMPQPEPAISQDPPVQTSNFTQMNSEVAAAPQAQTMTLKKRNGIMLPLVFGIVGLVFIAIYVFFWANIFNFKLPFLP